MSFFPSWQHSSVLKNEQIINPNQGEGWGGRAKETKRLDGGGKEGDEWKKERESCAQSTLASFSFDCELAPEFASL